MNNGCHDLTVSVLRDGESCEIELEPGTKALSEIRDSVAAGELVTLGAVWAEDRAIDIACESGRSTIVVVEIPTGITYTYLNPLYTSRFERAPGHPNVFVCEDMDEFAEKEENSEALAEVEINGADCPVLHVCDNPDTLMEIITCFLESGGLCLKTAWLKS